LNQLRVAKFRKDAEVVGAIWVGWKLAKEPDYLLHDQAYAS
jgi:hypothetical protein